MSNESGFDYLAFLRITTFLVFLTLKLAEVGVVAAWSWWWVTAPLWGPWAVVIPLGLILGIAESIVPKPDRPLTVGPGWTAVGSGVSYYNPKPLGWVGPVANPKPVQTLPTITTSKLDRLRRLRASTSGRRYGAVGSNFGWSE